MAEYIEKDTLCNWCLETGPSYCDNCVMNREGIPAADVRENVMGEWVQHYETTSDNETLPYGWECSLCGRWEMEKQPFCNCGAKMGVQDG